MSLTTHQVLQALEASNLLPAEAIQTLRDLVAEAKGDVQPRHLAKWAVDHGHLTPFQAKELLAGRWKADGARPARTAAAAAEDDLMIVDESLELVDEGLEVVPDSPPPSRRGQPARSTNAEEDDLEIVDEAPAPSRRGQPARPHAPAADELEVVEEEEDLMPPKGQPTFRGSPSGPGTRSRPPAPVPQPAAADMGRGPLDSAFGYPPPPGMPVQGLPASPLGAPPSMSSIAQPRLRAGGKKLKVRGNIWDSTLLYWGGGTLLALLIVGGVLLWRVNTVSGDDMLRDAKGEYDKGNYTNAIHQFDLYLQRNPKHPFVSLARVQRGLAQMRQVVDSGKDWPRALKVSEEVLQQISSEKEFPQGQGEISAMLPKIAVGLAEQADKQREQALVDQARQAVVLVNKFVPKTQRPVEQMQDVEDSLALTLRSLERSDRLKQALLDIRAATEAGDTPRAYAARDNLLSVYPDLETDTGLQEAILAASLSERSQVKYVPAPAEVEGAEPASPLVGSITLAATKGAAAAGVEGRVVFALVEGAAYGLDAASGQVLWRRFVGGDTHFVPRQAGVAGDALLVDSRQHDLLRVEAATGVVRWRRRIGQPLAGGPVILRDGLLAATRDGRVLRIDWETGASAGAIQLPQRLAVAPAADVMRRKLTHIYQIGEHSNLYAISADGTACDEVIYLGHALGSVVVPPVVMSRYCIVAENVGLNSGSLRVLLTDEQGLNARQVQRIALDGHVHAPPLATSKELLVATDHGALYSFEAGAPDKSPKLEQIAHKAADSQESFARYLHVNGPQFWVAENQLTRFDVRAATGQLTPQWVKHIGEAFLQPPVHAGEYLFHVRRRSGLGGATVTAANISDGSVVWETHVGAPLAGPPLPAAESAEPGELLALSSTGALFQVAPLKVRQDLVAGTPFGALDAAGSLPAESNFARLADGLVAFGSSQSGDRVAVLDPQSASARLRWLTLPDALACGPAGLAGKLLAAGKIGQVALIDPRTGQPAAEPFQPALSSDAPPAWVGLCPLGEQEALISDGKDRLYRIGVAEQPRPHLAALAEVEVDSPLVAPIAILDDLAVAVDESGRILAFRLPGLSQSVVQENGADVKLADKPVWGPARVGEQIVLATTDQELIALNATGTVAWSVTLGQGRLVGAVAAGSGKIVAAAAEGTVLLLDAASGRELGRVEIGQPLAAGPVVAGTAVVLAGHDGTLHIMPAKALRIPAP